MSKKIFISLVAGLLLSTTAQSATVYISDVQFVAVREGLDNSSRAVERGLKSGTPLEVLEQLDGHTKVITPNGNEGWVADYFLSDSRVTRDQLTTLGSRLTKISKDKVNVEKQLQASRVDIQNLNKAITSLKGENAILQEQLKKQTALAEKAKAIVSQNDDVSYQLETLKQQTQAAQAIAQELQDSTQQKWFMLGAATLFGGLILGSLLPLLRRKKTSTGSWS
ncbi:TIGR04211 family SH3 domain-containing protein [Marinomonas transparens]|uniref:TIGR04211 family SH3 domain-containing protein n=1 Tax=Marinomonas transparens TaxID=2795388 RepID=A0A934JT02_9GAMM|nr:TIGR04211 family SH3 domain-containing protein [Marinomonas transparens]MBJ7537782.1 TIGR04211 family SH3 domain-containing protein [Marinomonas transparens]